MQQLLAIAPPLPARYTPSPVCNATHVKYLRIERYGGRVLAIPLLGRLLELHLQSVSGCQIRAMLGIGFLRYVNGSLTRGRRTHLACAIGDLPIAEQAV